MTSDSIPMDLILDILLRLSPKSIARFHCVSKLWASMLCRPYFKELFLTRPSVQPRLLLAFEKEGLWSFYSFPQHLSSYEKSSSSLVVSAEFHTKFPPDNMGIYLSHDQILSCRYASGLICFEGKYVKDKNHYGVSVICNPITGRYAAIPWMQRYAGLPCPQRYVKGYNFFLFDKKKFKVLLLFDARSSRSHYKIMTLRTGRTIWRRIKCSLITHKIASEGICINGVLYYLGETSEEMSPLVIVCFDVRLEEFKFINRERRYCKLINYKGKLGLIYHDVVYDDYDDDDDDDYDDDDDDDDVDDYDDDDYDDDVIELHVWILEDVEKEEWSKYTYTLRDNKFLKHYVSVVGVTATGEIIFSMASDDYTSKHPFYLLYFNPEKNTLQRVEIQGLDEEHGKRSRLHIFVDHVEDLN